MAQSISLRSPGGETALNFESGDSLSRETAMNSSNTPGTFNRPRVSFHEVLNEAVRRQSQDTSNQQSYQSRSSTDDSSRESPWNFIRRKVKSWSMPIHDKQPCQSDNDHKDDLVVDIPEELKKMRFGAWRILQCLVLLIIVLAMICSLNIPSLSRLSLWDLPMWKWEAMILALVSGHLISSCVVRVIVKVVEPVFLQHRRVLYFIYGLWRAVQNCLWLSLVLLVWYFIFNAEKKGDSLALSYVTKVLVCFLVASVIWLLKTLLVKVLASSFHVHTYFERIHEALFDQFVIETLSVKAVLRRNAGKEECGDTFKTTESQHVDAASIDLRVPLLPKGSGSRQGRRSTNRPKTGGSRDLAGRRINQKSASAWYIGRMMDILQHETLMTLDEKILDSNMEDGSLMEIRNVCQAREVARKIFLNVAKPGSAQVRLDDLTQFMKEDEAAKTISRAAAGRDVIDKKSLESWVINAFKEKRALARSLNDTNTAVDDLHNMLNVLMAIFTSVIWLTILGVPIMNFLIFLSSQFILLAFVFGNSCKTVFEAMIFLFVMHPYDVGDVCEVDGGQMVVEEMNILTTVFRKPDNLKIRYPNSVLATKAISNYNRSAEMVETIDFALHISTPMEKIHQLKAKIIKYVVSQRDHWHPEPLVLIRDLEDMNKIKMTLSLEHRVKRHEIKESLIRRAVLIEHLIEIFRQDGIEYRMLPLDVNVRNLSNPTLDRFPSNWTAGATEH